MVQKECNVLCEGTIGCPQLESIKKRVVGGPTKKKKNTKITHLQCSMCLVPQQQQRLHTKASSWAQDCGKNLSRKTHKILLCQTQKESFEPT